MLVAVAWLTILHGTLWLGPTTPVCRAGSTCTRPAAHANLVFTRAGRSHRVTADAGGRYRVKLAPGTWRVRASVGMRISPMSVVVRRVKSMTQNFAIDTGIR